MENLTDLNTLKQLLAAHGLHLSKARGQNFLVNPSVAPKMAEQSVHSPGVGVLEIGPGVGVLTRELAVRAKKVVAIELDRGLLPLLDQTLGDLSNVKIIHGDAMKLDLGQILSKEFAGMPVAVSANIPYYITSPLIMRLLESGLPFTAITLMLQREAAERIAAPLPGRNSGAITVMIRYYAEPKICFPVSRESFFPVPKVDSAVVSLLVRKEPPVDITDAGRLRSVVKAAFGQRRKTLLNSLSGGLGLPKTQAADILRGAGVEAGARPEQLSLRQFAAIANGVAELSF